MDVYEDIYMYMYEMGGNADEDLDASQGQDTGDIYWPIISRWIKRVRMNKCV